ncbi:MAG: hypothetical protein IPM92_07340 [Saprospiraceae bacterium]|nr:hypothetical protein [Saprospiraceae bacterium]
MNTTFCFGISVEKLTRRISRLTIAILGISFLMSGMQLKAQTCLQVEKTLLAVAAPASGITGNFDAIYRLQVVNTNACGMFAGMYFGISVIDQLNAPGNLGTAFVRVVGLPIVVSTTIGSNPGVINPLFDGSSDPNLTDGTGFFAGNVNDTVIYQIRVEIDPNAINAPAQLQNSFTVSNTAPIANLETVTSNFVIIPNCWANCQLVCNNQVQVSVNSICEAEILADMILEGEIAECSDLGFFEVTIFDGKKQVFMPLDQSYINKKLSVNVRNIVCDNSCWGYIVLEDKSPPELNCRVRDTISCSADISPAALGFPVPLMNVNQNVYPYVVTGIDACGIVYLTYQDSLVKYECSNPELSATIYRKWCASDPGGYQACCFDTIDLRRGTLADITLPPHYDGQPGNRPYLLCNGSWTKLPNGFPDTTITGTGKPNGIYCGNIQYDFQDDTIQVCKGTYKLLRRWLILDWCNPSFRIDYIQQIKVVDDRAPLVTCPSNYTVNTNPWNCDGTLILPVPQDLTPQTIVDHKVPYVIENCSGWDYSVTHLPAIDPTNCKPVPGQGTTHNVTQLPDGRFQVSDMPLGCNWIYYTITDGCGNYSVCQFDIEVVDNTPPVAVCHQKTVISLGSTGRATVPASVFDDHSHDNCDSVTFRVRRMNPGPCGTTSFAATQEFCCNDVHPTRGVMMVLRVIDKAGNSSECMVEAFIQDKLPPDVKCPGNVTVNCGTDLSNLNVFGSSTSTDNCNVTIQTRVYNNLNSCNLGTLVREFIAIDNGGLRDSCQQMITVVDPTPFRYEDIVWPRDTTLNGCTDQADPSITGKPVYLNKDACNQPIASSEDLVFNYVEGVCFKILRKWTVIDWCTYNPQNGTGIWYRTQVIKINNTEAPTFTSSCSDREFCITEACRVSVILEASATDLCTSQSDLRWTYHLDLNNDGVSDLNSNRNRFSFNFMAGIHRITWTVEDLCGNSKTCTYLITIKDCKRPTPYCKDGLVTVLMQNNRTVTVWAKDFIQYGEDNCTPSNELKYSFTTSIADSSRVFTCADIANGISDTIEVNVYITDNAGNQDVCKTKLILQDNSNVCPDMITLGSASGFIKGYNDNPSPEVVVFVSDNNGIIKQAITGTSGNYIFNDLQMYQDYKITANYDMDPMNGITTKDIVKIQRHILGLELMDTPYKLIAADVNKSGSITARDISELRKLILGVQNQFEDNTSWNFVDANTPIGMDDFMNYTTKLSIDQMSQNQSSLNFIGIKTGDVTGEANTGFASQTVRSRDVMFLEISEQNYKAGELVKVKVKSFEKSAVMGMQFALELSSNELELVDILPGAILLTKDHYRYHDGQIRLSWNENETVNLNATDVLFEMVFKANQNGNIHAGSLRMNHNVMVAESYHPEKDKKIELLFRNSSEPGDVHGYALFQNVPNPFMDETMIYFNVPVASIAKIHVYNLSGHLLNAYTIPAKPGMNTLLMTSDELKGDGVLYYRLDVNGYQSMRKMVILK